MSFGSLGEDIAGAAEDEASVQERLAELQRKAVQNRGAKKQIKKDEGKAKQEEDSIIQFLLQCIQARVVDSRLVEALISVSKKVIHLSYSYKVSHSSTQLKRM